MVLGLPVLDAWQLENPLGMHRGDIVPPPFLRAAWEVLEPIRRGPNKALAALVDELAVPPNRILPEPRNPIGDPEPPVIALDKVLLAPEVR
jgi:hypothetical protein